jgi:hypothetical protein
MTELSKRARSLIDAARGADEPTPEARARGDAAVRVALAMHGVTDLPALEPPRPSAVQPEAATAAPIAHAGLGLKVGVGVALLSASLLAVLARPGTQAPKSAVDAPPSRTAEHLPAEHASGDPPPALPEVTLLDPRAEADVARGRAPVPRYRRLHGKPATSSAALEAEVRLISTANGLVRTHRFADALRVLEAHAQRFPRGALREEGSALRVLSLCGADAGDARALRERARFLRRSPSSVLAERVRASCAGEGAP